jgi:hypothetical protein
MARRAFAFTVSLSTRKFYKMVNCSRIARDVYDLADSTDPIAPLVKEALSAIDEGLDHHGFVRVWLLLCRELTWAIIKQAGARIYQFQWRERL